VIHEVLETGGSPTVERANEISERREDIKRRRALRRHFLSRAEVFRVLRDPSLDGPRREAYRGDLQMHSEWSDGSATLKDIAEACRARGYAYAAVTDHSYGLKIAGGMSMAEAAEQRRAIEQLNAAAGDGFRLLQGIEANIGADGRLDLSPAEAATFDIVLAAPHSLLRKADDQTRRLVNAIETPHVRILAHPRGRMSGSRAGVAADWDVVFRAAEQTGVALEIDGDPARQDLDFTLARQALEASCLLRSTATRTRRPSFAMPRPRWHTRGSRVSAPTGSPIAGRSTACAPGWRSRLESAGPGARPTDARAGRR